MNTQAKQALLIRLQAVIEILRASIWTGMLADEKPVSIMLIAKQESAKTECLKYFFGTRTLAYRSDLTGKGINPIKHDIEHGRVRHIVLLDLIRILAHGKSVTDRTLAALAALMEEGEGTTSDAGGSTVWSQFPKIGLLTAITPEYFHSKRGHWRKTGFLSRFVPVSFSYSLTTVVEIHEAISKGHHLPMPQPEKLPEFPMQVKITRELSVLLGNHAAALGREMKTYGFRYHRVLRSLAKAEACMRKSNQVEEVDARKVISWCKFFSLKEIEI